MALFFKVGDTAKSVRSFSADDVERFAESSGDRNPIHLDEDFARASMFGERIVHGMLVASLFSGLLGGTLPGEGTIYLSQSLSFKRPVPINAEVTAIVRVIKIREDKPIVTLETTCVDAGGEVVIEGEAVVMVPFS